MCNNCYYSPCAAAAGVLRPRETTGPVCCCCCCCCCQQPLPVILRLDDRSTTMTKEREVAATKPPSRRFLIYFSTRVPTVLLLFFFSTSLLPQYALGKKNEFTISQRRLVVIIIIILKKTAGDACEFRGEKKCRRVKIRKNRVRQKKKNLRSPDAAVFGFLTLKIKLFLKKLLRFFYIRIENVLFRSGKTSRFDAIRCNNSRLRVIRKLNAPNGFWLRNYVFCFSHTKTYNFLTNFEKRLPPTRRNVREF